MNKVPKICQDFAEGIGFLGQLISNAEEMKTDLALRHALGETSGADSLILGRGSPFDVSGHMAAGGLYYGPATGQHDSVMISRGVVVASHSFRGIEAFPTETVTWLEGAIGTMEVVGVGQYFFPLSGFATYWAEASPMTIEGAIDATQTRFAVATSVAGGVYVQTFQLGSRVSNSSVTYTGLFIDLGPHMDFHFALYGSNKPSNPFVGDVIDNVDAPNPRSLSRVQQGEDDFVKI